MYYVSGKTRIKGKTNSSSGTIKILTAQAWGSLSWKVIRDDIEVEDVYKYKGLKDHGRILAEYFFA